MRYTLLANGRPIESLRFLPDLDTAKRRGEELAASNRDAEISVEGHPEQSTLGGMQIWRLDREIGDWVATSTPVG